MYFGNTILRLEITVTRAQSSSSSPILCFRVLQVFHEMLEHFWRELSSELQICNLISYIQRSVTIPVVITRVARWLMYIQTKNPNFGKFWRVLEWKILVDFMTIWNILWPFGLIYGHLV
jgi:hypothetical protein